MQRKPEISVIASKGGFMLGYLNKLAVPVSVMLLLLMVISVLYSSIV